MGTYSSATRNSIPLTLKYASTMSCSKTILRGFRLRMQRRMRRTLAIQSTAEAMPSPPPTLMSFQFAKPKQSTAFAQGERLNLLLRGPRFASPTAPAVMADTNMLLDPVTGESYPLSLLDPVTGESYSLAPRTHTTVTTAPAVKADTNMLLDPVTGESYPLSLLDPVTGESSSLAPRTHTTLTGLNEVMAGSNL